MKTQNKEKVMKQKSRLYLFFGLLLALTLAVSGCVAPAPGGAAAPAGGEAAATEAAAEDGAAAEGGFTIGVSNTLVGNGWREQ
ncbi:MAG: hypothetical protein KDD75_22170, partial [Caldilineaceae bacterium]|nr:hypothetical protein [Caldilineaceae bacterium]